MWSDSHWRACMREASRVSSKKSALKPRSKLPLLSSVQTVCTARALAPPPRLKTHLDSHGRTPPKRKVVSTAHICLKLPEEKLTCLHSFTMIVQLPSSAVMRLGTNHMRCWRHFENYIQGSTNNLISSTHTKKNYTVMLAAFSSFSFKSIGSGEMKRNKTDTCMLQLNLRKVTFQDEQKI